jgi:hypothetical protein
MLHPRTVFYNLFFDQVAIPHRTVADVFKTLIVGHKTSTQAVRQPKDNSPVLKYASGIDIICNSRPAAARETVPITAGGKVGFRLDIPIYHKGPAAIYLGHAPGKVAGWDGRGRRWFKVYLFLLLEVRNTELIVFFF